MAWRPQRRQLFVESRAGLPLRLERRRQLDDSRFALDRRQLQFPAGDLFGQAIAIGGHLPMPSGQIAQFVEFAAELIALCQQLADLRWPRIGRKQPIA